MRLHLNQTLFTSLNQTLFTRLMAKYIRINDDKALDQNPKVSSAEGCSIRKIWGSRKIVLIVLIKRIVSLILFIVQITAFSKYIEHYNDVSAFQNISYALIPECNITNITGFTTINGTTGSMIDSLEYPTKIYISLTTLSLSVILLTIFGDIYITKHLSKRKITLTTKFEHEFGEIWSILFLIDIITIIVTCSLWVGIDNKIRVDYDGSITGSVWAYECSSGYIPIMVNTDDLSVHSQNQTCVYELANIQSSYIYCIKINDTKELMVETIQNISGYEEVYDYTMETYQEVFTGNDLLYKLTFIYYINHVPILIVSLSETFYKIFTVFCGC